MHTYMHAVLSVDTDKQKDIHKDSQTDTEAGKQASRQAFQCVHSRMLSGVQQGAAVPAAAAAIPQQTAPTPMNAGN